MIEVELNVAGMIADTAEPLPDIDDPAFGAMFDRYGEARVVLLGEASHGTSEFYRARAAISQRLIERYGFNIVAVEADWPDAATIDRYVRHRPWREGELRAFERFPTWMWLTSKWTGSSAGCASTISSILTSRCADSTAWIFTI